MGLDMYLNARKIVGGHARFDESERKEYNRTLRAVGLGGLKVESKWLSLTVCLLYWRKANQIHRFFVQQVQGGIDECRQTGVNRDQLFQLLEKCREVHADNTKAAILLPTQEGFFFGSTLYNAEYFSDIKDTITGLEVVLANDALKEGWHFIYQSSW